jgi:hypothetical protein
MHVTLASTLLLITYVDINEVRSATFQNLAFELANVPTIPRGEYGSYVPSLQGLPSWTVLAGANQLPQVIHNNVTVGGTAMIIWGPDWPYGIGGRIEGNFTALFAVGGDRPELAISQSGFVPTDSQWLLFKGLGDPIPAGRFVVSLDGQSMPITALENLSDYSLYGARTGSFAGREAELRFTVYWYSQGIGNYATLDSIMFSPVPEPGMATFFGLGVCILGLWRWLHSRKQRP